MTIQDASVARATMRNADDPRAVVAAADLLLAADLDREALVFRAFAGRALGSYWMAFVDGTVAVQLSGASPWLQGLLDDLVNDLEARPTPVTSGALDILERLDEQAIARQMLVCLKGRPAATEALGAALYDRAVHKARPAQSEAALAALRTAVLADPGLAERAAADEAFDSFEGDQRFYVALTHNLDEARSKALESRPPPPPLAALPVPKPTVRRTLPPPPPPEAFLVGTGTGPIDAEPTRVGDGVPDPALSLLELGWVEVQRGEIDAGVEYLSESLLMLQQRGDAQPLFVAEALHRLGCARLVLGQLDPAEALITAAHGIRAQEQGTEHADAARCLGDLFGVLITKGDFADALLVGDEARRVLERAVAAPDADPDLGFDLAAVCVNVAMTHNRLSQWPGALGAAYQAMHALEQLHGAPHAGLCALLAKELGHIIEAEPGLAAPVAGLRVRLDRRTSLQPPPGSGLLALEPPEPLRPQAGALAAAG